MPGLLADGNADGHLAKLLRCLDEGELQELWHSLNIAVHHFEDLHLARAMADSDLWRICQKRELILITGNRNHTDDDSLEATIRRETHSNCFPVITIANPERMMDDAPYAVLTANRLLEILFDWERYLGTGRLFIP